MWHVNRLSRLGIGHVTEKQDEEFSGRLKIILEKIGTLQAAGEMTGFTPDQVARWRDGKARPPFKPMAILAREAGLSLDWLAYGVPLEAAHLRPQGDNRSPDNALWLTANEHRLMDAVSAVSFVPLLDVVASAGPGVENPLPFEIARLPFPSAWLQRLGVPESAARFIDSRGDSMEPTIPDGAICLVDTRVEHARKDGIYVLIDGPNVRIKRIAIGWQNAIVLISDNERYASEALASPDAEALRIAGKVVWAGGEI